MLRNFALRLLLVMTGILTLGSISRAATLNCEDVARLSELLAGGDANDGCFQADKLWSNFAYSITSGPNRAGLVTTSFVNTVNGLGQDIHQVFFIHSWSVPFTLSYTISIFDNGNKTIVAADNQASFPLPTGSGDLKTTIMPAGLTVDAHPPVNQTDPAAQVFPDPLLSVNVTHTYTPGSPASTLTSFNETFTQAFIVPEPATCLFMGSSLLVLGLLRRFRR